MLQLIIFLSAFYWCAATDTPIIGILEQPSDDYNFDTFVAGSYVKFLESAGARVLPIWINQTQEYYERVVHYTNGVLFPGGFPHPFNASGNYGKAARTIYQLAQKSNNDGKPFTIWGTCLGFEVLPYAQTGTDQKVPCSVTDGGLTLHFTKDSRRSVLFGAAPEEIFKILETEAVNYNSHKYCITEQGLLKGGIHSDWRILTTNKDNNGLEYISTMENKKYPFYGVQFHPEKNAFEFHEKKSFPHSINAIKSTQYFANFFVNEARKSFNKFPNHELELKSLIYNYCPTFSGVDSNYYYQIYGFNKEDYKNELL